MGWITTVLKKYIDWGWYAPPLFYETLAYRLLSERQFEKAALVFEQYQRKYPKGIGGFEGLAVLAKKTGRWKLLLRKLEDAIKNSPDRIDLICLQIEILSQIGQIQKAQQRIEKNKSKFPNNSLLALTEIKFLREQYDYQSAQTILDHLADDADDVQLKLMRADNYWQLGDFPSAKKILEAVRPSLNFKKKYLSLHFTYPYIEVLLANNELARLQEFFEQALSKKMQNWEIISGYSQLLIGRKKFQEAAAFIEKMIREEAAHISIRDYALLFFEGEKIKHIQSVATSKAPNLASPFEREPYTSFFQRLLNYLESHTDFERKKSVILSVFKKLTHLGEQHPAFLNTAIAPQETYWVAHRILAQIRANEPFSFIRLGDGEGHFLPYEEDWEKWKKEDRLSSQKIWWGEEKISDSEWQTLEKPYHAALQNADLLGIPCPWRSCRTFLNVPDGSTHLNSEARGLNAVFDFLLSTKQKHRKQILTSCHIHSNLEDLDLWDMILEEVQNCSVISCHPALVEVLSEKHNIHVRTFYAIPSEYKYHRLFQHNQQSIQPHYPNHFDTIRKELTVAYQGEIFLVAAGFLGKFYCQIIKEKGGIALDVGSAADYWLNFKTRVWTKFPNPLDHLRRDIVLSA